MLSEGDVTEDKLRVVRIFDKGKMMEKAFGLEHCRNHEAQLGLRKIFGIVKKKKIPLEITGSGEQAKGSCQTKLLEIFEHDHMLTEIFHEYECNVFCTLGIRSRKLEAGQSI